MGHELNFDQSTFNISSIVIIIFQINFSPVS